MKASAPSLAPQSAAGVLCLYELAWRAALPLLRRHGRLAGIFEQRCAPALPRAQLWLHAASAGECRLAVQILGHLRPRCALHALITSNTVQGLEMAHQELSRLPCTQPEMQTHTALAPFDRPSTMRRAVAQIQPKLAALLETELWPGLLSALKSRQTPVLVLNGRMTPRSLGHYRLTPALWARLRPTAVAAVSAEDAARFAILFGPQGISVMSNIKFDLMPGARPPAADSEVVDLLAGAHPVFVLGSIRRQEEAEVERILLAVRQKLPQVVTALFPRHMERIDAWRQRLSHLGLNWRLRSAGAKPAAAGEVILWDRFGELGAAYHMAHAALVGGSLAPLGGQNFLEALLGGTRVVIGPHWHNFHWVGREPIRAGWVTEALTWQQAAAALTAMLAAPAARHAIQAAAQAYLARRGGGTQQACAAIAALLPDWFESTTN